MVVALTAIVGLAAPWFATRSAAATPSPTPPATAPAVQIRWDGPTVPLDWSSSRNGSAEGNFVGDRVLVPGEAVQRTARITNAGPGPANVTVSLVQVDTHVPPGATNTDLAAAARLFWDIAGHTGEMSWADAADDDAVVVATFPLDRNAEFSLTTGVRLAMATTGANAGQGPSVVLTYLVRVDMVGQTAPPPPGSDAGTGGLVWSPAGCTGAVAILALTSGVILLLRRHLRESAVRVQTNTATGSAPPPVAPR